VQRPYPAMDTVRYGLVPRLEIWILPTLVTDRFGNWVRYTYGGTDGWRVTSFSLEVSGRSTANTAKNATQKMTPQTPSTAVQ